MIRSMDKGSLYGHQAIHTKGIINMMRGMDMEKCTSLMVQCIRAIGTEGFNVGKLK
jgi:hypothetical protein